VLRTIARSSMNPSSDFYKNPHRYFEDSRGYILSDSAYQLSNRCLKPFSKKDPVEEEDDDKIAFNCALSSAQVKTEHAFSLIKTRFAIMTCMTTAIGDEISNGQVYSSKLIEAYCRL
jgi:hypothetical protein